MTADGQVSRAILPIPDRRYPGLVVYDAKDADAKFPPILPLRPPASAPNVLIVLLDDVGFGASSAFGGPVRTPTAERLAAQGLKHTRPYDGAVFPNSSGAAERSQSPRRRDGWDHRDGNIGTRIYVDAAQHLRSAG
jgi:hypothetical protein